MSSDGRATRWVVLTALVLATGVMFAVSLRGNYLYGHSLGQTQEKAQLFGWANVAADLWKAFGLIAVSMLWRARHYSAATLACLAWLMCLLFGLNSALGLYVHDRATLTGTRAAQHATYQDMENSLAAVTEKLRIRKADRSVGEVEAEIAAILARAVMSGERVRGTVASLSRDCTKIETVTRQACDEVATLRQEFAAAVETRALEEHARTLREEIIRLRERGGSVAPDPVGEFYGWLTGGLLSVRDVGFGFPLFFALLIEVVSAFGPLTIAAYAEATRPRPRETDTVDVSVRPADAGHGAPQLAVPGHGETKVVSVVVLWIAERAVPTKENKGMGIADLYGDYEQWCGERSSELMSIQDFESDLDRARALPELAGKIRKFGDRYYGLALQGRKVAGAMRRIG